MEVKETLQQVLERQIQTCTESMDRAWVVWSESDGVKRQRAKERMDMWEQRKFDAQFHLDKLLGK